MKKHDELIAKLKKVKTLEEGKRIIEEFNMELTDDELEGVSGGSGRMFERKCSMCGKKEEIVLPDNIEDNLIMLFMCDGCADDWMWRTEWRRRFY